MNESQLYEALGRKQAAFEALQADYRRFLAIVAAIKGGTISIDRLEINGDNWSLGPDGPPAEVMESAAA